MKKTKKILSLVLVLVVCFSCMNLYVFASDDPAIGEFEIVDIVPRSETGTVLSTTDMWASMPYSQITNSIQCVLYSGDTIFVYSYGYDYTGNLWTYCVVTSCARDSSVVGFKGWIDASDLSMVGT